MEAQSPDGEMAFGLSNQARIEPVSPVHQMPCWFQNGESPVRRVARMVPGLVGMEVDSPPGCISPEFQSWPPFPAVSPPMPNRLGIEAGYQMPLSLQNQVPLQADSPTRDCTPSPVRDISKRIQQMAGPSGRAGVPTPLTLVSANALRATASPQMLALGELEFDRVFLIHVYLAGKKIEDVVEDADYIKSLKSLPMDCFESEIWDKFGSRYAGTSDRRKNVDWDPSKTRLYHCNIEKRGDSVVSIFKGPYIENTRTHLQKNLGDDNVLIVKFADIPECINSPDSFSMYRSYYRQVAEDGIILGLRRYRFFIYKDGGKGKKQRENNDQRISSVWCYFVRTESGWERDEPYILSNKTIDQARRLFMHIHMAPTFAKYVSRFGLILSKTITLDVKLSEVNIRTIPDVPCKVKFGINRAENEEPLIHTDGTGLISSDLALECPTSVFKGKFLKGRELQDTVVSKKRQYLIPEHPLLMQVRMFHNGCAVKGTLLVDYTLPAKTIHIRPSMIKIKADPNSLSDQSFNSLEIVTTSNRPKRAYTSRSLIALLHYGGVPEEYFMELLGKAREDADKAHHKTKDLLEVAFDHSDMDDSMSGRMILSGIQPEDEAYLQYQLALMTKEERKGFKQGKIPIDKCYYLMGTTDPTGTLKPDQVCVILDEGQVSGKILVYKHPGLHFGDIHRLTATYIDGLEKIVGEDSKYAIFFPTSGERSLADEMANSDFDGDIYWVSRNPQLLEHFEPREPWVQRIPPKNTEQKNPQDYNGSDLESLLFLEFMRARFSPSYVLGTASNCWLTYMDRLLTCKVSESEKKDIEAKMLDLVDINYLAVDASKKGYKIEVPKDLMVYQYPHFLERERSYRSTSVLGKIYDEASSQQSETAPPIKILPLLCFFGEIVSEEYKNKWTHLYDQYLKESSALCKENNKEEKDIKFKELYQKYNRMLYEAEEFERSRPDLFDEACAVYQVVYERAMPRDEVSKCGFAWKVAGRALCELYALKCGGETMLCSRAVLEQAFKTRRA